MWVFYWVGMMDIHAKTARLAQLMEDRLDVRGADFTAKVRRAGRLLPRHVREAAGLLCNALPLMDHPQLSRQVKPSELENAAHVVEAYLLDVDPWERRRGIAVSWLSGLAFSLLVLVVAVVLVLVWRGYL